MNYGIIFLGNPGKNYAKTRHNAGWMLCDTLPWAMELSWQTKFKGQWSQYHYKTSKLYHLKPETYMNRSGESVAGFLSFFKIASEKVVVVHDDLELPFGKTVLKNGGGLAGHNGLKSIKQATGSTDFMRLRIGIGKPDRGSVSSWVLSRFSSEEEAELPDVLKRAVEMLLNIF